jgi:hypothetical protein
VALANKNLWDSVSTGSLHHGLAFFRLKVDANFFKLSHTALGK